MPAPDPQIILEALSHGATGDHQRGLDMLQPMVDAGPRSTFALLGSLAEMASKEARDTYGPDTFYGMAVETPDGRASADVLPPPVRFATQFITAWANRDQDTAHALFLAAAKSAEQNGTDELSDGITAVYAMAAVAAEHVVLEQRRLREEGDIR
ncbi:hypothetical protein [Streptomyces sp. A5-4]|uniref:hypothetical protein n=1 Tax=Streptomyces sp. A5-4 TaxID=3384771 RepID=UPI003DAA3395